MEEYLNEKQEEQNQINTQEDQISFFTIPEPEPTKSPLLQFRDRVQELGTSLVTEVASPLVQSVTSENLDEYVQDVIFLNPVEEVKSKINHALDVVQNLSRRASRAEEAIPIPNINIIEPTHDEDSGEKTNEMERNLVEQSTNTEQLTVEDEQSPTENFQNLAIELPESLQNQPKKQRQFVTVYQFFRLVVFALVIVLGSFQFGYAVGILNTPKEAISGIKPPVLINGTIPFNSTNECAVHSNEFFNACIPMTPFEWNILVSSFVITALLGSLIGGTVSEFIGRRNTVFFSNVFFMVGTLLKIVFSNYYVFVLGRLIHGFGVGLISVVIPIYLSEISPPKWRGTISTLHSLSIAFAIFLCQTLGIFLSFRPGWRFLLSISLFVSILQLFSLPYCPKSPKLLFKKGNYKETEEALIQLRGTTDVQEELKELEESMKKKTSGNGFWKVCCTFKIIKTFLIGIGLHITQQLAGINAVMFYSTPIFESTGIQNAPVMTAVVGLVNLLSTIGSVLVIERLGRKILLIASEIFSFICFVVLSVSFVLAYYNIAPQVMNVFTAISIIMYIVAFAFGLGAVPWTMTGELFPSEVRGVLSSICVAVNWTGTFLVGVSFDSLNQLIKPFTFFPFTVSIAISIILGIIFVPETKGRKID